MILGANIPKKTDAEIVKDWELKIERIIRQSEVSEAKACVAFLAQTPCKFEGKEIIVSKLESFINA